MEIANRAVALKGHQMIGMWFRLSILLITCQLETKICLVKLTTCFE